MSIPVTVEDLAAKITEYGWAYLLTVRGDQRPHIVAVTPTWVGEELSMGVGRGTAANIAARSSISLCYPPVSPDGYSLIIDGVGTVVDENMVSFAPGGAVLHRPAPEGFAGSGTGCEADCAPVVPSAG
jgi:hypothetical protein